MPGFLGGSGAASGGTGGEIRFPKEFVDPVTKLRVSNPENLIDTDFEYGLQPTKWETVELINNTPSFFSKSGDTTIPGIVSVTTNAGTREITVTTGLAHGLAVGIPINVQGSKSVTADGSYIINSIPDPKTFTYLCRDNQEDTSAIEDLYTSIITGEFFQGSQLRISEAEGIVTDAEAISTLTVTTSSAHGFGPNTPFYFLNLNSTISQEFEAANTEAKSFDSSNSATAQTFDGSNSLSTLNIDWSNSATVGGTVSTVSNTNTAANTVTVAHSTENFAGLPLGQPLYYNVTASLGYFFDNPRGVVFLKTIDTLDVGASTFQVSAVPSGDAIPLQSNLSGTFQIANQARTFAGNNVNPATQIVLDIVKGTSFEFEGANDQAIGGNGISTVTSYSGSLVNVSTVADAGLEYYQGAMLRYTTTGSAANGLVANATYFVDSFFSTGTDTFAFTLKALPNSESAISVTGGTGTQRFTRIGVSLDKDVIHIRNSNFAKKDMIEYTFPVGGNFEADDEKLFYFIATAYDSHNYLINATADLFTPMVATGGTILPDYESRGRTYRAHQFTNVGNSTFTVQTVGSDPTVEYLVIAGGGGGCVGGGGAGGYRSSVVGQLSGGNSTAESKITLSAQGYTVLVGAGGLGRQNAAGNQGFPGGTSSAFGISATGGGGGGGGARTGAHNAGVAGGSGGGGHFTGGGGAGISGQGFAGGAGEGSNSSGGGGGGAGGVGAGANTRTGGAGLSSNITGSSVSRAGGGGGISGGSATSGGGAGGVAGTANTGGGGGGSQNGLAGGSGIVIIRYPLTPPVEFTPANATGGTITTVTEGNITYRVHSFTTVGTSSFAVQSTGSFNEFEYLLVAGGGGGGGSLGGGGGAGGLLSGTTSLSFQTYSLSVGQGGAGGSGGAESPTGRGNNGANTTAFGLVSIGGGGGGTWQSIAPSSGGSGGGGDSTSNSDRTRRPGGAGTSGQGFAGGSGIRFTPSSQNVHHHGGGGGAGGPGQDGADVTSAGAPSGDGGPGILTTILGVPYYFAGGGGGGAFQTDNKVGNGGLGGGGGGSLSTGGFTSGSLGTGGTGGLNNGESGFKANNSRGGDAGASTGSGGGGATWQAGRGGNGGSGIVIIRYPIAVAD